LVCRSVAEKSIRALVVRVLAFKSASSPIISFAVPIRAFDFVVLAFGPRRSHSISSPKLVLGASVATWMILGGSHLTSLNNDATSEV